MRQVQIGAPFGRVPAITARQWQMVQGVLPGVASLPVHAEHWRHRRTSRLRGVSCCLLTLSPPTFKVLLSRVQERSEERFSHSGPSCRQARSHLCLVRRGHAADDALGCQVLLGRLQHAGASSDPQLPAARWSGCAGEATQAAARQSGRHRSARQVPLWHLWPACRHGAQVPRSWVPVARPCDAVVGWWRCVGPVEPAPGSSSLQRDPARQGHFAASSHVTALRGRLPIPIGGPLWPDWKCCSVNVPATCRVV